MKFTKMHGLGNDYIYINGFKETIDYSTLEEDIIKVCHRHFGIGADGVILILPSSKADARMRMFNADGSEGQMCGNGIRCVGKYVYENGISKKKNLQIETLAGIKELSLVVDENDLVSSVNVNMGVPSLKTKDIPAIVPTPTFVFQELKIEDKIYNATLVSMGNPHCVIYTDSVDDIDLELCGKKIENAAVFPERINVEFVQVVGPNELKMRVWERGSGETMACGTGSCASVVASVHNGVVSRDKEVTVHLKGGDLFITYTSEENVIMRGSATKVFEGEIEDFAKVLKKETC